MGAIKTSVKSANEPKRDATGQTLRDAVREDQEEWNNRNSQEQEDSMAAEGNRRSSYWQKALSYAPVVAAANHLRNLRPDYTSANIINESYAPVSFPTIGGKMEHRPQDIFN